MSGTDDTALAGDASTVDGTHPPSDAAPAAAQPTGSERYALGRELGRGGMGRVLEADDRQFGRRVAVKCLFPDAGPEAASRFATEAVVTGSLAHGGIPSVHERGELGDGTPFYAMQKIDGRSLADVLRDADSPADRLGLIPLLVQVAQTIAFAHSRGVVHRDLKPANVVVGKHGQVVVVDWGLAKVDNESPSVPSAQSRPGQDDLTHHGQILGTPAYMSPEQARGKLDDVDARTDVFGLGAILYQVLTGHAPFTGATAAATLEKAAHADYRPIRELNRTAPPALVELCDKALSRNPEARLRSAELFAERLDAFTRSAVSSAAARVADIGSVGFGVLTLVVGAALVYFASASPILAMSGIFGLLFFAFTALGCGLSTIEWLTRGRYRLAPVALGILVATVTLAVGSFAIGMVEASMAIEASIPFDDTVHYRHATLKAERIALSACGLGMVLAAVQAIAWGVARRRASG